MKKDPLDILNTPIQIDNDDIQPSSQELVINEILSLNAIETKTDLDNNLVLALTKGAVFRDLFDNAIMGKLVNYVYLHRISLKRLGRTELKDMVKALGGGFMEEDQSKSMFNRIVKGDT